MALRAIGNCDPPGGGHVALKSGGRGPLTDVTLWSMSVAKEGSCCGAGDKLPVPGVSTRCFKTATVGVCRK